MGFKIQTWPATLYGCLADFSFYRELAGRPLGEAFIYLLLLLLVPALLLPGYLAYETNRTLAEVNQSLRGNLPLLRVDQGTVIMDGEDYYHFEAENDFPVERWRSIIAIFSSTPDWETQRLIRRREAGEELTGEEQDLIASFEAVRDRGEAALAWSARHFPREEEMINSERVERQLAETPPDDGEVGELLEKYSRSFNYAFRVDLAAEEPRLPPGMMGYALGPRSYTVFAALLPEKIDFREGASKAINDSTLERWRKTYVLNLLLKTAGAALIFFYLISLLLALGGSAAAGLTASLLKCSLSFRRLYPIALYALTPAVIFSLLAQAAQLLGLVIPYPVFIALAVYVFYLISAARNCCTPA